ncbi:hypothetical protein Droror1_Dr00015964 [Drosera rotundifolia]
MWTRSSGVDWVDFSADACPPRSLTVKEEDVRWEAAEETKNGEREREREWEERKGKFLKGGTAVGGWIVGEGGNVFFFPLLSNVCTHENELLAFAMVKENRIF